MKKNILILTITLFSIACTANPYSIKSIHNGKTVNIEIEDKIPPKKAKEIIDYLYDNYKEGSKTNEFLTQDFDSLSSISYWHAVPGSTGKKHTECKYEATFYIKDFAGETLCIGIHKNKLKALWSSSWAESLKPDQRHL